MPTPNTTQSRWKSKYLWTSIVAFVVATLIQVGIIDTTLGDVVNNIVSGILDLLVIVGIVNNPTDSVKW